MKPLHTLLVGVHEAITERVWTVLKILSVEIPYDLVDIFLGIYPKELKSGSQRSISSPVCVAAR